uniref:Very long-chain fatty acid transport protein n=1 Tax=Ciona intestinalis TaxID=7719 RepID=F7B684_CIOIN
LTRLLITNRENLRMARNLIGYGVFAAFFYTYVYPSIIVASAAVSALYYGLGGWEFLSVFRKTIKRDLKAAKALIQFKFLLNKNVKHNRTINRIFDDVMRRHPRKVAVQWEDVSWSFHDLYEYSNAVGNYFHKQGFKHGDVVAIFADNRPEYIALWLGLAKIGVTAALINYNLRKDALAHCINISLCKGVVYVGHLGDALGEVHSELKTDLKYYVMCGDEGKNALHESINIDPVFKTESRLQPPEPANASYFDKLMFIYTSGTTGLPKAAVISHSRFYYMCTMSNLLVGYNSNDNVYCSLPLYHSNGGIVGLGQMLCHGIGFTIRSKFSASRFWTDCKRYNCTVILYIGEICRYLLAQPVKVSDRDHNVRIASGNGLRPEIWTQFVERFNIGRVAEFYGATEGNANLMNTENVTGSCGFISVIAPTIYPVTLLKVDEDQELVRDKNGLCIKCKPGEYGMLVGKIIKQSLTQRFDGYADKEASKKKVAYDVLQKGDSVFMTGDVLTMDKYGNMYFKDRTGDTFRWKGENVSTAECEAELGKVLGNQHTVAVYGVTIPGTDGKAGMAAVLDVDDTVDLEQLYDGVVRAFATYARPLFVRKVKHMEITGTHKIKKVALRKEGYNVNEISDPLFFLDAAQKKYVTLDGALYAKILDGGVRV